MYVLPELWRGNISPLDSPLAGDKDEKALISKINEESRAFIKELSAEGRNHFDKYENLKAERSFLYEEKTFIEGFRLGARMILDVLEDSAG